MREIAQNSQMRAIILAVIGAIMAAAATMFVPVAVLEGITGSTGLSELVPATAAPLGDTARALIAFGTGALVLAVLAIFLSRSDAAKGAQSHEFANSADSETRPSLFDRLPKIALPKMPWVKGEDDITDFADLPKLRNGDVHPDAPPRRPLIATQDLPELDLATVGTAIPEWADDSVAEVKPDPVVAEPAKPADEYIAAPVVAATSEVETPVASNVSHEPTLAEMVAQLEAAVAQRQQQLAALTAVTAELVQSAPAPAPAPAPAVEAEVAVEAEAVSEPVAETISEPVVENEILPPEPVRFERPPLEAVPARSATQDDMDAALTAALETLQRMNATAR